MGATIPYFENLLRIHCRTYILVAHWNMFAFLNRFLQIVNLSILPEILTHTLVRCSDILRISSQNYFHQRALRKINASGVFKSISYKAGRESKNSHYRIFPILGCSRQEFYFDYGRYGRTVSKIRFSEALRGSGSNTIRRTSSNQRERRFVQILWH